MLGQCVRLFVPPWTVAYQASLLGALQARALEWVAILSHGLECAEAVACGVDDHVPLPPPLPPAALASHSNQP